MIFNNLFFLKSATDKSGYPNENLPEIAFVGRSNVGKSSLINALCSKTLARTSKKPGKTIFINFYESKLLRIVDLPGFGYAIVSKNEKQKWQKMIEDYLIDRKNLSIIVQLVDIRHRTENDVIMTNFIKKIEVNSLIVATKSDKLSQTAIKKAVYEIAKELNPNSNTLILPVSSSKKNGIFEINEVISKLLFLNVS